MFDSRQWRFIRYDYLRKKQLKRSDKAFLKEHFLHTKLSSRQTVSDTEFLVLDFETTGIDPKTESPLSLGYTVIKNNAILCDTNRHFVFHYTGAIPDQSVAVHHITEQQARNGTPAEDIMPELIKAMTGRVLVAHYAKIEHGFIQQLARKLYGLKMPMIIVDTLTLEYNYMMRIRPDIGIDELRLFNIRDRHGMPRYKAHNALTDAIATAELFLLQTRRKGRYDQVRLVDLL